MPSPKGPNPEELEAQAKVLQELIDDAQTLQKEITDHLKRVRGENRSNAQPISERPRRSR